MIQNNIQASSRRSGGGQIYSFDVLKFFMALMIVAIHTKAFHDVDVIMQLTNPFLSAAVPVFFVLSSYFLFRKMELKGYTWDVYKPFLKRLLILYLFWLIATSPTTLYRKLYYWDYGFPEILFHIVNDFLFSYTFPGSWFLSALIIGSLLVFVFKRYLKAPSIVLLSIAAIFFFYMNKYDIMPLVIQKPYLFIQTYIREEVALTSLTGIIWCCVGCVMAKNDLMEKIRDSIKTPGWVISTLLLYILMVVVSPAWKFLVVPFFVLSIIILAYCVELEPSDGYKRLRNLSILIYLIHFQMLLLSVMLPDNILHIVYYAIVLGASLLIAFVILKLENYKYLSFLKYSH